MIVITLTEILFFTFWGVLILTIGIVKFMEWLQQRNCGHTRYRENQACNAICIDCHKNLGFIANIREKNPKGER